MISQIEGEAEVIDLKGPTHNDIGGSQEESISSKSEEEQQEPLACTDVWMVPANNI